MDNHLTQEERETLDEMPLRQWFYATPKRFIVFFEKLQAKGFVEKGVCTFNKTGIKWRRIK